MACKLTLDQLRHECFPRSPGKLQSTACNLKLHQCSGCSSLLPKQTQVNPSPNAAHPRSPSVQAVRDKTNQVAESNDPSQHITWRTVLFNRYACVSLADPASGLPIVALIGGICPKLMGLKMDLIYFVGLFLNKRSRRRTPICTTQLPLLKRPFTYCIGLAPTSRKLIKHNSFISQSNLAGTPSIFLNQCPFFSNGNSALTDLLYNCIILDP